MNVMLLFFEFIIVLVYEFPLYVIIRMWTTLLKIYKTIVKRNYLYPLVEEFNNFKMDVFRGFDIYGLHNMKAKWAEYKVRVGIYILFFICCLGVLCIILILLVIFLDVVRYCSDF